MGRYDKDGGQPVAPEPGAEILKRIFGAGTVTLAQLRHAHENRVLEAGRAQLDLQTHERKATQARERYNLAKAERDALAAAIAKHPEA